MTTAEKTRCIGHYKNGNPCRSWAVIGEYCKRHHEDVLEAALSGELEAEARRIAERMDRQLAEQKSLTREHRGFRLIHRGSGNRDAKNYGRDWQVVAVTYEAAIAYCDATGERMPHAGYQCGDMYDIAPEDIIAQIDDLLDGHPAEEVVMPDGGAVVVSPGTGAIYQEITPEERAQRLEMETALEARHQEAVDRRIRREAALAQDAADREVDIQRQEAAIYAESGLTDRQIVEAQEKARMVIRDTAGSLRPVDPVKAASIGVSMVRGRLIGEKEDRERRAARRQELAALHERQDRRGEQRTNLEGQILCDSCQRSYHDPAYDYCYGCGRGRKNPAHRARMASGEIAERKAARQAIREGYLAPQRAAEQAEQAAMRETRDQVYQQALADAGVTEEELREYALRRGIDHMTVRFSFSYKQRLELLSEIAAAKE